MDEERRRIIRRIVDNGMIAALYFALTLLLTMVPVLSQFGPIQCRFYVGLKTNPTSGSEMVKIAYKV